MSNLSLLSSIAAQLAPDSAVVLHTGSKRTRQVKEWFEGVVSSAIEGAAAAGDDGDESRTPDLAFTKYVLCCAPGRRHRRAGRVRSLSNQPPSLLDPFDASHVLRQALRARAHRASELRGGSGHGEGGLEDVLPLQPEAPHTGHPGLSRVQGPAQEHFDRGALAPRSEAPRHQPQQPEGFGSSAGAPQGDPAEADARPGHQPARGAGAPCAAPAKLPGRAARQPVGPRGLRRRRRHAGAGRRAVRSERAERRVRPAAAPASARLETATPPDIAAAGTGPIGTAYAGAARRLPDPGPAVARRRDDQWAIGPVAGARRGRIRKTGSGAGRGSRRAPSLGDERGCATAGGDAAWNEAGGRARGGGEARRPSGRVSGGLRINARTFQLSSFVVPGRAAATSASWIRVRKPSRSAPRGARTAEPTVRRLRSRRAAGRHVEQKVEL